MSEYEKALSNWNNEGGNVPVEEDKAPQPQEKEYDDVEDASVYVEVEGD